MTQIFIGYARCSTDKQDLAAQKGILASFGVASMHCSGHQSVEALVGQADTMLYQAKAAGRNRVEYIRLTQQVVEK